MKKKFLLLMICSLTIFGLTGCDVPLLPTSSSMPSILQEPSESEAPVEESSQTTTEEDDTVNIEIDGQTKTENTSKEEPNEESSQTKLVTEIITKIQEQNIYTIDLDLSYSGKFNYDKENVTPSSFKNVLNLSMQKDKDSEYKLSGNGNISVSGGELNQNNDYSIIRYLNTSNEVFYEELSKEIVSWKKTGYSEDKFPKIGINRNNLKTALNESTATTNSNYYIFTVTQSLEKAFEVIELGGLEKIFNDKNLKDINVTYEVYINKESCLIEKIILRKSFNYLQANLKHSYVFNLTKDVSKIEGSISNTVISNIDIVLNFDFNSDNIHIDDSIIYESTNGRISDKYDYKTELTKYDFIDIYNKKTNILATFDCSEDNSIKCSGYVSGLACDFYEYPISGGRGNYLGSFEIYTNSRFLGAFGFNDFDVLEKEERDNIIIYRFKDLNNKSSYYISINDNYGLVYSNGTENANIESLNKILEYMNYK